MTPANSLEFSPDGSRVLAMGDDGILWLFDAASGKRLLRIQAFTASPNPMIMGARAVYSPDGTRILTFAPWAEKATVRDARTGTVLVTLAGHAYPVSAGAWSPGGELIVTGSFSDGTARVWDAGSGDQLDVVRPGEGLGDVLFPRSPDGTFLVRDQNLDAYRCDVCVSPRRLLSLADTRVTRPLTEAERTRYHIG
jgi:WD40 repeat protein